MKVGALETCWITKSEPLVKTYFTEYPVGTTGAVPTVAVNTTELPVDKQTLGVVVAKVPGLILQSVVIPASIVKLLRPISPNGLVTSILITPEKPPTPASESSAEVPTFGVTNVLPDGKMNFTL